MFSTSMFYRRATVAERHTDEFDSAKPALSIICETRLFTPNLLTKTRKQTNETSLSEDTGSRERGASNWRSMGECLK